MSDWRPFEPSREAMKSADDARDENTCNRHKDCAAATAAHMQRHGLKRTWQMPAGFHCHSDDCEECFGS